MQLDQTQSIRVFPRTQEILDRHSQIRLSIALCFMITTVAHATDYLWDNSAATNDYSNASNWVGDIAPVAGSANYAIIGLTGSNKATFSTGTSANLAALYIGNNGTDGEFHQIGGTLNFTALTAGIIRIGANEKTGTYVMSGGVANLNIVNLGLGSDATGNMIVTGGDMKIHRSAGPSSTSLVVDAGTEETSGKFEISGGSLETRNYVTIGNRGIFSVLGSGATNIGIGSFGSNRDGKWTQESGGTLRCRIASTGIRKIVIHHKNDPNDAGNGNVVFMPGALLDVGFLSTAIEGEWDIMSWQGTLTNHGLALAPGVDPTLWNFYFVDTDQSGSPDTLRVKTGGIVQSNVYSYNANLSNTSLPSVAAAYSSQVSTTDAINDGQDSFTSETQPVAPSSGAAGLNDGNADGSGTGINTFYSSTKFNAPVTYKLNTNTVPNGYDISGITSIAGWHKDGAGQANQSYEVWIRKVGESSYSKIQTVYYKPFTSSGLNGNTGATKVDIRNSAPSGILARGVDSIRFIFKDDGENFSVVNGTVYQEIDVFTSTPQPPLSVAEMFSSSMILQRDIEVPIWGYSRANANITVKLDNVIVKTATADIYGNWVARMPSRMGDGGLPHTLTISAPGEANVVLTDVLFGDVYIASGQSNMARTLSGVGATAEINAANFPKIRQIKMALTTSSTIKREPTLESDWTACSPQVAGQFCAVGYYFAKNLQATTGEPVGLLFSAWGGRLIEQFTSREGLAKVPGLSGMLQNVEDGQAINGNTYSDIYNAMIAPMSPYGVRGALWYQGEFNAGRDRDIYKLKLSALIRGWRSRWGQASFSFAIVQLPNYNAGTNDWPIIREAQRRAVGDEPDTGLVVTIDAGDNNDIHPTNKKDPGERLAKLTLAPPRYQVSGLVSGPLLTTTAIEGNQIRVNFENATGGLVVGTKSGSNPVVTTTGLLQNFEIAGANMAFVAATAVISGETVLVSSPSVTSPMYVRYCYANAPVGGNKLYNSALLPASPFRTNAEYELEVVAGSGGGTGILAGTIRNIVANAPPAGMTFDRWIGSADFGNPNAASTTVKMPTDDLYLLASYRPNAAPTYQITVINGNSGGTSQADSIINLKAIVPAGKKFVSWTGNIATVVNPVARVTTLRMPAANVTVTANLIDVSTARDGIPDTWRALHFGGDGSTPTSLSAASADPDSDVQPNLHEYQAGTDPNDPKSFLKANISPMTGSQLSLEFPTVRSNRYFIQSSETMADDSWEDESYEIIGDGQPLQFPLEPSGGRNKFFRVKCAWDVLEPSDGLNGK
jgi:Carbohydrate esterase, sialic acid-specific acetylesterase/Divergent InlB B-repeat domain